MVGVSLSNRRRRRFVAVNCLIRYAIKSDAPTLEIDAALTNLAEKPAGVADKQKRAPVLDERIHALAAFFLESGVAHGKSLIDNEHFGLEKRGHVQAPIFPSATRACSASNCMR